MKLLDIAAFRPYFFLFAFYSVLDLDFETMEGGKLGINYAVCNVSQVPLLCPFCPCRQIFFLAEYTFNTYIHFDACRAVR